MMWEGREGLGDVGGEGGVVGGEDGLSNMGGGWVIWEGREGVGDVGREGLDIVILLLLSF